MKRHTIPIFGTVLATAGLTYAQVTITPVPVPITPAPIAPIVSLPPTMPLTASQVLGQGKINVSTKKMTIPAVTNAKQISASADTLWVLDHDSGTLLGYDKGQCTSPKRIPVTKPTAMAMNDTTLFIASEDGAVYFNKAADGTPLRSIAPRTVNSVAESPVDFVIQGDSLYTLYLAEKDTKVGCSANVCALVAGEIVVSSASTGGPNASVQLYSSSNWEDYGHPFKLLSYGNGAAVVTDEGMILGFAPNPANPQSLPSTVLQPTIPGVSDISGAAFDGTNFWLPSPTRGTYRVTPGSTTSPLLISAAPGRQAVFTGTTIKVIDNNTIFTLNPQDGSVIASKSLNISLTSAGFDGVRFWAADKSTASVVSDLDQP